MSENAEPMVQMVPIDQIHVINPRSRGQAKFRQIVSNIGKLGLKKPITLARRKERDGQARYDLVCGQGRLEAYQALGQSEVPAIVVDVSRENLMLMSLAENLARRRYTAVELARDIAAMKERGHDVAEIARITDLPPEYIRGVIRLLSKGETRLLRAVENGQIPISIAITIASADDETVQRALAEAYENHSLRGKALLKARQLIEYRRTHGKDGRNDSRSRDDTINAQKVLKTFHREMAKHRVLVKKAKVCETRLLFLVSAFKSLIADEHFINLLRAEGLDTLPQFLAEQIKESS